MANNSNVWKILEKIYNAEEENFKVNKENRKRINLIVENSGLVEKFRENIMPIKSIEEQAKELEYIYGDLINQQGGCL